MPPSSAMTPRHIALAVLVAAVWGLNFVLIEVGLHDFPPLLFCALRFAVVALPAVFLVGSPRVAWRWVLGVGLTLGVVKFGLLFLGMHAGMPAGLSSLVLQGQAGFTALFAAGLLGERPARLRVAGLAVAFAGIALAAVDRGAGGPVGAFALVIGAAVAWGLANVLTRRAAPPDALRWMVWVSAVPPLPLLALSLLVEGPDADWAALRSITWSGVGAVLYVGLVSTLFGFVAWSHLLRRYDASLVAPYSLLVPVFGMSSAALLLGERFSLLAGAATVLVIAGIGLGAVPATGWARLRRRVRPAAAPAAGRPARQG
ncbi:O-acetylserine/cysteine efflux transporter [Kitasatospora cineracea]|uniref:O-acetylserine/cysteine efflux transporter n=2 Tax=Kitasatospora cineracea TaxID=88074 RepID=A0A3N4RMN5_9ACTN|nr:O-acetylserine/cysteine efflux transporter [Kitasatospora cineracea]RPE32399.1 O-acetylserine/cysteine efflux transporter [Kitasatospora cineracea]